MINMKFGFYILFSFLVILAKPAFSQNDSIITEYAVVDTLSENFGLFDNDDLLEISLRFDITYYKKKKSNNEFLNAILTYHKNQSDSINKVLKVRSRGEFRRTFCDFPPLLLNFKLKDSTGGEFASLDKLKMVTHCKTGNEEYLLKEYLIYKLYNVLTDNSFRVRLLRVKYINTARQSKPISKFAFVIEPDEVLAKRINSVEVETPILSQKNIKPEIMDRMAIFNYMIGNTDWSVPNYHNVVILSQGMSERPDLGIIVPYDFDYSGLVDADYAIPFEGLGIKSVRDRLYIGICRSQDVFLNALREFLNKKEEFYKVITEFPYLDERSKKDMIYYLKGFFSRFDKRNTIVYELINNCRKF
jgi:hypothetical protein